MSSFFFLFRKTVKNYLIRLRKRPGMIVLYAIMMLLIAASLFSTAGQGTPELSIDSEWLELIIVAYILMFFYMAVSKGLSTGGSFFNMCDVNILFVAPISPKKILAYGLIQQTGKTLLASVFILFQGSTLRMFGFGINAMFVIFINFMICMILSELLAMCIYTYTNMHIMRKRIVKVLSYGILFPVFIVFIGNYLEVQDLPQAALTAIRSGVFRFLPIAGWANEFIFGFLRGEYGYAILFMGLNVGLGVILMMLSIFGRLDYYEDVLVATETDFSKRQAIAEGNLNAATITKKEITIRAMEIWGRREKVFLGKHMLENSRQNRFHMLDFASLIMIATGVLMGVFNRKGNSYIMILTITMYLQSFLIGTGRGLKELYSHYIYLVPASPFQKIVWSNLEVVLKITLESFLTFGMVAIILQRGIGLAMLCAVVKSLFSAVLVSSNLLSMRIFKDVMSRGILMFLYFAFLLLIMAPGVIVGVIVGFVLGSGIGLIVVGVWELLVSLLLFYLSRDVLNRCDMEVMPKKA